MLINEEKAAIVRKIFTDYINGKNSMQIASELNEIGVKTTRGNPFENKNNRLYPEKSRLYRKNSLESKRKNRLQIFKQQRYCVHSRST